MAAQQQPRYAYEDPAALAWGAQLLRTARRRRLARLAAEQAEARDPQGSKAPAAREGDDTDG
jgi:hypothetical protein